MWASSVACDTNLTENSGIVSFLASFAKREHGLRLTSKNKMNGRCFRKTHSARIGLVTIDVGPFKCHCDNRSNIGTTSCLCLFYSALGFELQFASCITPLCVSWRVRFEAQGTIARRDMFIFASTFFLSRSDVVSYAKHLWVNALPA